MAVERVEGVREAAFSYEAAAGSVRFDTTSTDISTIIDELEQRTGFKATVRMDEEAHR